MSENPLRFIKNRKEEIISNLRNLIAAKTENPPGNTTPAIETIASILDKYSISYEIVEPEKGKKNLIAEVGKGDALILNGHVDVVPAGQGWDFDPFKGEIINGRIYGRGATDMKSGVIALLYAFIYHREIKKGKLILSIVADEETGAKYGTKYLLNEGLIDGIACIIAEPTGSLPRRGYNIVAGERGVLWAKIKSKGKAGHGSLPMLGENAIKEISKLITLLPEIVPGDISIPEEAKDLIINGKEVLEKKHPKAPYALDHYTINVGVIKGGKKVNAIPDEAEIEIDMRVPIGSSSDQALKTLESIVPGWYEIEVKDTIEPSFTPSSNLLVESLRSTAKMILNYDPKPIAMAATTDARLFRYKGIPTVNFGPGYLEVAHARNEFVYLQDVLDFTVIYIKFIENFFSHSP